MLDNDGSVALEVDGGGGGVMMAPLLLKLTGREMWA